MTPKGPFSEKAFFYTVAIFCSSEAVEGVCICLANLLGDCSVVLELK